MNTHPLEKFNHCPACGSLRWTVHNEKAKQCPDCGFVYYANAYASTAAFLFNEKGELLVCRRAKDPARGTLDLPGGFVDMDETAEEAMKREIMEELGLEATSMQYLFSLPNRYPYSGMTIHTLDLFFAVQVADFSRIRPADDVSEAFFLPLNTISPNDFGLDSIKKGIIAFLKDNR